MYTGVVVPGWVHRKPRWYSSLRQRDSLSTGSQEAHAPVPRNGSIRQDCLSFGPIQVKDGLHVPIIQENSVKTCAPCAPPAKLPLWHPRSVTNRVMRKYCGSGRENPHFFSAPLAQRTWASCSQRRTHDGVRCMAAMLPFQKIHPRIAKAKRQMSCTSKGCEARAASRASRRRGDYVVGGGGARRECESAAQSDMFVDNGHSFAEPCATVPRSTSFSCCSMPLVKFNLRASCRPARPPVATVPTPRPPAAAAAAPVARPNTFSAQRCHFRTLILGMNAHSTSSHPPSAGHGLRLSNRLDESRSPYVRGHMHNPVAWQLWGPEAIDLAKKSNRLIFISIGYAACHWCHVMERESFENDEVAKLLNDNFIPIKIDREERPDVDRIYMNYVQATTGSGGWPLNVFITPDLEPIFGGTYWPGPGSTMAMGEHIGFVGILKKIRDVWRDQRQRCLESAKEITAQLRDFAEEGNISRKDGARHEVLELELLDEAYEVNMPHSDGAKFSLMVPSTSKRDMTRCTQASAAPQSSQPLPTSSFSSNCRNTQLQFEKSSVQRTVPTPKIWRWQHCLL